jgi:hypothetical protein
MFRLTIGDVVEGIAAAMVAVRAGSWMKGAPENDGRSDVHAAVLEHRILAEIQLLANAGHILPRLSESGEQAPTGIPIEPNWYLTRDDVAIVRHSARGESPPRPGPLLDLDEWRASGRYTLAQAAEILAVEAREKYERILRRLKKAAADHELPMYAPGENLKFHYPPDIRPSAVRGFWEEVYWSDLNDWLNNYEKRISWRFPNPPIPSGESTVMNNSVVAPTKPSRRKRGDALAPLVKEAVQVAGCDTADVWALLFKWASQAEPKFPLLRAATGNLFFQNYDGEEQLATRKNITDRIYRSTRKPTALAVTKRLNQAEPRSKKRAKSR